jgi:hypothetical protein
MVFGRAVRSSSESQDQLAAMRQKLVSKPRRVTGVRLFMQQARTCAAVTQGVELTPALCV